jgi:hypothetical protein
MRAQFRSRDFDRAERRGRLPGPTRGGTSLPGHERPCLGTSMRAYKTSSVPFPLVLVNTHFELIGAGELRFCSPTLTLWLLGAFGGVLLVKEELCLPCYKEG